MRDKTDSAIRHGLKRIIERAVLTPWPRITHNLRSSRQTELCEDFPAHVVSAWLGNSTDVADKHYLQVTDDHFQQATARAGAKSGAAACKVFDSQGAVECNSRGKK